MRRRQGRVPVSLVMIAGVVGSCAARGPETAAFRTEVPRSVGPTVRRLDGGWVEVAVSVVASDEESPAQARTKALQRARAAACEFVSGTTVRSQVLSFQAVRDQDAGQLVQALDAVFSEAVVVDERVLSDRWTPLPGGGFQVDVTVRARVVDRRGQGSDPAFTVEVRLPRQRFLDGEEVTLQVRSTRRARLYVFNLSQDGAVLLLPNAHREDTVVEPGQWLDFPDPDRIARGVRLLARLPAGQRRATESLLVVALRGDRELPEVGPVKEGVFRQVEASGAGRLVYEVLGPLVDLEPSEWAITQTAYEIWER